MTEELDIKKHITLLGSHKPAEMPFFINQADVLVFPSRSSYVWKEQYGEVVGNGGLLFQENNAEELANCLRRLIDVPWFCKELGEKGYKRANTLFSQREIARKTLEFYRKVASQ